ncbi:hypothetical protein Tco_1258748 [Tanacetum coccineum]
MLFVFYMAQHVIPAAQLVPRFHIIGRCNNYAALNATDVPTVYLQQFWRTVSKVLGPEDTIKFMLNTQEFIYTMDMFQDILHLPVETPKNPFVAPVNIKTIEAFMNRVGYQGVVDKVSAFYTKNLAQPWKTMFKVFNRCLTTRTSGHDQAKINILQMFYAVLNQTDVDYAALLWWDFMNNVNKKKEAIEYPRFIKLIIADLMKKFPDIPQRIKEDYHSINDDIPLVSVYTNRNVLVRGMLIPDVSLTEEIRATDDFKEYETMFMNVDIEKMVEGDEDEESYESEFAISILNDDVDDSGTKIEPESHKENPENVVDDDEEIDKEKKDEEIENEKKDDNVEKMDEVVKEKDTVRSLLVRLKILLHACDLGS